MNPFLPLVPHWEDIYSSECWSQTLYHSLSLSKTCARLSAAFAPMKKYTPTIIEFDPKEDYPLPKHLKDMSWSSEQYLGWLRGMAKLLKDARHNKESYSGFFGLYDDTPSSYHKTKAAFIPPTGTTSCYGSAVTHRGYGKGHIPIWGEFFQGSADAENTPYFEYLICRKHSPHYRLLPDCLRAVYDDQRRLKGYLLIDTAEANAAVAVNTGTLHRMIHAGARANLYRLFQNAGCTRLEAMLLSQLHYDHREMISYGRTPQIDKNPRFISHAPYQTCFDWSHNIYIHSECANLNRILNKKPHIRKADKYKNHRTIWEGAGYNPCNTIWGDDESHKDVIATKTTLESLTAFNNKFFGHSNTKDKWGTAMRTIPKTHEEATLKNAEYILAVTDWFKKERKVYTDGIPETE